MKKKIVKLIKGVLESLNIEASNFSIEHPDDFENGDYSTNVAMVGYAVAKDKIKEKYNLEKRKQAEPFRNIKGYFWSNPKQLAEAIKIELEKNLPKAIEKVEVAGPGFINFYLSREFFTKQTTQILDKGEDWGKNNILLGKKIMVEYTDPNPFKPFHIGHLMANAIGESISRIVEYSGTKTIRANYQGDVGPHVAKAIYVMLKNESDINSVYAESVSLDEKANYIGKCYSEGSNLYDTDKNIKKEIDEINKKIYNKSDEEINKIYDYGRKVTLDAFEEIYKLLGTKFDYYFFESEMAPIGEKIIKENLKGLTTGKQIFDKSEGAIVFHGEKYDKKLHIRVFINSHGLPTYEAKEIGLAMTKFKKEKLDLSIVTTAIEQAEYMKVVQKAFSLIHPELEEKMKHITHGMMKLSTGKMSSRKGNIITGESLINDSLGIIREKISDRDFTENEQIDISRQVGVSALKYSILKSSIGSDIIYDADKSVSFDGDSGPYLQYTVVRANSILNKAKKINIKNKTEIPKDTTDLEKKLYQFPEIVEYSYQKLEPHHIVTYLTELASSFNAFYANTQILKEKNIYIKYQLELVKAFYQTMKNGLWLLGIETPEKM